MATAKHPLFPGRISDLIPDLNTKQAYLKNNASRLGISSTELSGMDTMLVTLNTAQARVDNEDTRSKLDTAQRDLALDDAKENMRRLINNYVIYNKNATSVDFEALNVPPPGPYSHLPVPDEMPGIGHITSSDDIISAPFYDATGSDKKGKPEGAQAIEAYMKIGGEPPVDINEMTERKVSTASPMKIKFGPEMEGVTVYLRFRWVGTRGDYGQWSGVYKAIITP